MEGYEVPTEYLDELVGALMFLGFVGVCGLLVALALLVW